MIAFIGLLLLKKTFELPSVGDLLASPQIMALTVLVIYSVFAHGVILERKRWALWADYIRLALWAVCIPILFWSTPFAILSIVGAYVLLAIFAFWLIRMRNFFDSKEETGREFQAAVAPHRAPAR